MTVQYPDMDNPAFAREARWLRCPNAVALPVRADVPASEPDSGGDESKMSGVTQRTARVASGAFQAASPHAKW